MEVKPGCCARWKWSLHVVLLTSLYMTQAFTFFATHALELTNLDALYPNVEKWVGPDTSGLTLHTVGGAQSITSVHTHIRTWVPSAVGRSCTTLSYDSLTLMPILLKV